MNTDLYDINVAGVDFKLRSPFDQKKVEELTSLVSEKVEEIMNSAQGLSYKGALLLASLHFVEELTSLKKSAREELDRLERRTHKILSSIESSPMSQLQIED